MRCALSIMLVLGVILANPLIVKAETIFSTFGPGDSYDNLAGAGIFGPPNPVQNIAASFTPAQNYLFDSADLALLMFPEGGANTSNTFDVWLMSDSGGLPGTIIESFSLSIEFNSSGIYTVSGVPHPLLTSGTTYWVAVSPDGSTFGTWFFNDQGEKGLAIGHLGPPFGLNSNEPAPAFRVEGTLASVPEPATMILLGSGLLGLLGAIKKFKK